MKLPAALFALLALACPLFAQHVLVVNDNGKILPVVSVEGRRPFVLKDGKLVEAPSKAFSMVKAGEYLPVHVRVRNSWAKSSYMQINGAGELNKTFELHCELESSFTLENVFVVLLLDSEDAGKTIFFQGIDTLVAREPHQLDLFVPVNTNLGGGRYTMHLFVKGQEIFNSTLGFGEMEGALRRMVRDRIKGVQTAAAQPFVGPAPEYPKALRKKGVEGKAVLSFKIGPDGSISEPAVVEASLPEFGEAAMEVIRQWRFLPKVVNGRPVESKARMPFAFVPPKK